MLVAFWRNMVPKNGESIASLKSIFQKGFCMMRMATTIVVLLFRSLKIRADRKIKRHGRSLNAES